MAKSIQYQQFTPGPGFDATQQINQLQAATPYQFEFTGSDGAVDTEWTKISSTTGISTAGILVACATLTEDGEITDTYVISPNYNFAALVATSLGTTASPTQGAIVGQEQSIAKVATNVTTTGQTLVDVTGLTFTIAAGQTWQIEFLLNTGSSSSDGVEIGINIPANTTMLVRALGTTSGITAVSTDIITADATASIAYNTANAATGYIQGHGIVTSSTGAGAVQLQFLKVVSGTATILANSYLIARRIS